MQPAAQVLYRDWQSVYRGSVLVSKYEPASLWVKGTVQIILKTCLFSLRLKELCLTIYSMSTSVKIFHNLCLSIMVKHIYITKMFHMTYFSKVFHYIQNSVVFLKVKDIYSSVAENLFNRIDLQRLL